MASNLNLIRIGGFVISAAHDRHLGLFWRRYPKRDSVAAVGTAI